MTAQISTGTEADPAAQEFHFSPEQEQLRATVRRFLADRSPETEVRRLMETTEGFDPSVWKQMGEQLGLMNWVDRSESFVLDDYGLFDQHVESIRLLQADSLVDDRQRDLRPDGKASFAKLVGQTNLIGAFQQTRSQHAMHVDRRVHYLTADLIQPPSINSFHSAPLRSLRLCVK